jgi:hypothetical protein
MLPLMDSTWSIAWKSFIAEGRSDILLVIENVAVEPLTD